MTYTLLQTLGTTSDFEYGNNLIYWIESSVVYQYNLGTDTITALSDGSSFAAGDDLANSLASASGRPFYLATRLYVPAINDAAKLFKVYRWTSGTTWELVFSYDYSIWSDGGAHFSFSATRDNSQIIVNGYDGVTGAAFADYIVRYTSDGDTWSNGSVSWSSTPGFTVQTYATITQTVSMGDGSLPALGFGSASEGIAPFGSFIAMLQWGGTAWTEIAHAEDDFPYADPLPDAWAWFFNSGVNNYPNGGWRDLMIWYADDSYEDASTPTGSESTPTGTGSARKSLNFSGTGLKGFGTSASGNDDYAIPLDTTHTWGSTELISSVAGLSMRCTARSTAGKPIVIMWNVAKTENRIYGDAAATFPTVSPYGFIQSSGGIPGSIMVTT